MALASGPNLGLLVSGSQGEQHYAELLRFLRGVDALVQAHAKDKDLSSPPGSPADGDLYLVAASPSGAWSGQAGKLARWNAAGSAWEFYAPREGWSVWIEDEDSTYRYNGTSWAFETAGGGGGPASGVSYDNSSSGLSSTDVQGAIDELEAMIGGGTDPVTALSISSGSVTIDCSLGKSFTLLLNQNVSSITLTNLAGAGFATEIEVEIKQNGTGGWTVALPAAFKPLGGSDTSPAAGANAVSVLSAKTFDNGTTWRYAMQESA